MIAMIRSYSLIRFLKDVLITTILFFVLSYLFSLGDENAFPIIDELISCAIIATLFSIVFFAMNYHFLIDVTGPNPSQEQQLIHQYRNIHSATAPEILIAKMQQLKSIRNFHHDASLATIEATVPMDHLSFGEKLSIRYQKLESGYEYELSSKPRWWMTRYDYGKNLAHVNALEKMILNL